MQNQTNSTAIIPEWSQSDYLDTNAPYKWLYQLKDDPLKMQQMVERVAIAAQEKGIKTFKKLWEQYLKSVQKTPERTEQNKTDFEGQPLILNCGNYVCSDSGIVDWSGHFGPINVCSHPIMPVRRLINIDTGEVKIEVAYSRGSTWRKAIFDKQILSSSQKIILLASYGIGVDSENSKALVSYLSAMENMNYDELPEVRSVGRLGWMDGYGFSPYVENLVYDGDEKNKHMFDCVKSEGNYEEWLKLAKQVRSGKSIVARIMLAASFASAIVKPMDALSFLVHAWGNSGSGKSVSLLLAASVWAKPNIGEYCKSFNGTMVGNELLATFCGNLPLCLDELQCIKDKRRNNFDDIIMMLCEGVGKTRGARYGGLQQTNVWRNCTLSTGEMPITSGSSGTGAISRVIEIDCKDEQLFENPRETVAILTKNHGHAGKKFVEQLSKKECMELANDIHSAYLEQLIGKATDKQALSASLILTADALADLFIFDDGNSLKPGDIIPYLTTNTAADMNRRAYEWLVDTISSNPSRFEKNEYGYQGECWGTIDAMRTAYIIKSKFDKIMTEEGFSGESFLSWAKRNNLIKCEKGRSTIVKRMPGVNSVARCIALKLPDEYGKYLDESEPKEITIDDISDADESFLDDEPVEFEPEQFEPDRPVTIEEVLDETNVKSEKDLPF